MRVPTPVNLSHSPQNRTGLRFPEGWKLMVARPRGNAFLGMDFVQVGPVAFEAILVCLTLVGAMFPVCTTLLPPPQGIPHTATIVLCLHIPTPQSPSGLPVFCRKVLASYLDSPSPIPIISIFNYWVYFFCEPIQKRRIYSPPLDFLTDCKFLI